MMIITYFQAVVHEVLIVPAEYVRNRQMLDEMVREVNQICVEEEEILSDHAYYYDRSEDLSYDVRR